MKLRIKWAFLNAEQRKAITLFYQDEVKREKKVLNTLYYPIDSNTGKFVPIKGL